MNAPRYASAAAKLLAKHLPAGRSVGGDRARGLVTIERALAARKRRLGLTWGLGALAAAALIVLATRAPAWWIAARSPSILVAIDASPAGRGAALSSGDQASPMQQRAGLAAGQRIDTPPEGGASLRLSTGTEMELFGQTSFRVESQGATEHFSLQYGELAAHVAKLMPGQRFIITTPDAQVEVRGTRFRLRVTDGVEACGAGTRTRLEVSEGLVELRDRGEVTLVAAGAHWPADCPIAARVRVTPEAVSSGLPLPSERTEGHRAAARTAAAPNGTSQRLPTPHAAASAGPIAASLLSEQNDLFAQGVALRRRGDTNGALRAYSELMARFPGSPLAENALVERLRLLASKRDPSAQAEAQRYLARYPTGFAVQEAREVAARP